MIISGAAYASLPHLVYRRGEEKSMNRERLKSVNLINGEDGAGRVGGLCISGFVVRRISKS